MFKYSVLIFLIVVCCSGYSEAQVHPDTEMVSRLLKETPATVTIEIEYRPIVGLAGQSQWHIGQSVFWVRLQPVDRYAMSTLNKAQKYTVTGIVLEENYGMVDVWVKAIGEKDK